MNCVIIDDDEMSCKILEKYLAKTDDLTLKHVFHNPVEAINGIKDFSDIDLVFLDIEMPEMTGLDFLETIENQPQVIIVSSKEKYAVDAFNFDVTDYFLKPVTYARFFKGITKAKSVAGSHKGIQVETTSEDGFFFKHNSSILRLRFQDILWIEALENYICICTFDNKYTVHQNLKSIESALPSTFFRRVHRSFIANISNFKAIEDNCLIYVIKKGQQLIPIGKSYRDRIISNLNLLK